MNRTAVAALCVWAFALPMRASDVIHQDLDVDVTGDDVRVVIDARIDFDGDLPIFALVAPVVEVTVDGIAAGVREEFGEYAGLVQWIVPPEGVVGEADVRIVVEGQPHRRSVFAGYDACTYTADEAFFIPFEPGGQAWLISFENHDPFTATVSLRAADARLTSQGAAMTREPLGDGTTRTRYSLPTAAELVPLYARALDAVVDDNVTVGIVGNATGVATRMASTAAHVLPLYSSWYGSLPIDTFRVLPVSGRLRFGAMGGLGNVFIGDFAAAPEFDYIVEQGIAHEVAHSWWGGVASAGRDDDGGFLQEAFAEYAAWRALGNDDDSIRAAGVRMNAVWYLTQIDAVGDVPIVGAGGDEAYVLVTYHKGSGILRTLEEKVGAPAFNAALAALAQRGAGGLSVAGLVEDVQAASGIDITIDVEQWLQRTGAPTLSITRDGDGLVIDSGTFAVDVPVRVTRNDGGVEHHVLTAGNEHLDGVLAGAVLVEVDPRWTLVRTVAPALHGDVSCDGRIDAIDLMEVALRSGTTAPDTRRVDASFDPLYDIDVDGDVDDDDLAAVLDA